MHTRDGHSVLAHSTGVQVPIATVVKPHRTACLLGCPSRPRSTWSNGNRAVFSSDKQPKTSANAGPEKDGLEFLQKGGGR